MRAFFSVLGMYNHEEEIFADFRVPEGLDRTTAIHKILFDNAELGLVYTDPAIFPTLIKNWTDSNFYSWERAFQALQSEYNPIHNYDRHEEWTDSGTGTSENTRTHSGSDTDVTDGTVVETPDIQFDTALTRNTQDETTHDTTVTHNEAGYNEGNTPVYAYDDKTSGTETVKHTGTDNTLEKDTGTYTTDNDTTVTHTYNNEVVDDGSTSKQDEHEGRIYGNIGVTTTQKMIEEEMELRTKYNLYDMISMSFRSNFCIMVY